METIKFQEFFMGPIVEVDVERISSIDEFGVLAIFPDNTKRTICWSLSGTARPYNK